jgi:hypothetical protein
MIKQDYIMLIMNCKKYIKKAKFQKMTWLPHIPDFIKYYHVIGVPELDIEYKFDNDNNILFIKVEDDYNSLPKKVIRAYEAVNNTFDFKYIFKTDDDQILVNKKFFPIIVGITNSSKKIHYGGYIVDVKQNYLSQYHKIHPELPNYLPVLKTKYCSGRFYFLSKPALINLINKKILIEKEYLEDYAIGYNLDSEFKNTIVNIATNNYFTDIENSDFQTLLNKGSI